MAGLGAVSPNRRKFRRVLSKGTSPVAWQNVNLIGKFEFTEENAKVDIDALAARYNDPDFWRKSIEWDGDQ